MSDTKVRDLERRWKETGTVEDEAAYLQERVRVGDLTREKLELAAYCGHEAVLAASRGQGLENSHLLETLGRSSLPVCLNAAVVAAASVSSVWRDRRSSDDPWRNERRSDDDVELAIAAARDALDCPCEEHEEKAALAALSAYAEASAGVRLGFESLDLVHVQAGRAAGAAAEASSAAILGELERAHAEALQAIEHALNAAPRELVCNSLAEWLLAPHGSPT